MKDKSMPSVESVLISEAAKYNQRVKRRYRTFRAYYIMYSICMVMRISALYQIGDGQKALPLVCFTLLALLILLFSFKWRTQKYIDYTTLVYILLFCTFRVVTGENGMFGLIGILISIVIQFYFMSLPFATILNASRVLIYYLVCARFVFGSFAFRYETMEIATLMTGCLVISLLAFLFAMQINMVSKYRDRNLQVAIRYADEMRETNEVKSRFLSDMSHDIRTPMNAILGYASIAERHRDDPEKVQDSIQKIKMASTQLSELINDILDFSRVENGKETLNITQVSLHQIIEKAEVVIRPLAQEKQIDFQIDITGIQHEWVQADEAKLQRILSNILGNAVKFTGEHGKISLEISERRKTADIGQYCIRVKDNGIGMSKEFLAHIYESFSREKQDNGTQHTGTGLGMTITKEYVDMMGGKIAVSSELGVGTECAIRLDLPWIKDKRREDPCTDVVPEGQVSFAGINVLLADDSDMNREIVTDILTDEGAVVTQVCNGKEMVEKFTSQPAGTFDLILTDIRMPVMDGLCAARAIRAMDREDAGTIPIVALSANAFRQDEEKSLEAGINAHLAKPIDVSALLQVLQQHVKSSHGLEEL